MPSPVRAVRSLAAALACALLTLTLGPALGAAATGPGGPRVLPRSMQGQAAITALGARLDTVAARSGVAPGQLRKMLREDRTAWVAAEGQVYFAEEAPTGTVEEPVAQASYAAGETFTLHSRPGARQTIALDFNGYGHSNTGWSGTASGDIADRTYIGYDTDGSPGTFSAAEHAAVQEVWRQVAETYAPFDVDVTTAPVTTDSVRRTSTSDTTWGTHVVVTSDPAPRNQACGGCLGIAWMGTFDNVDAAGKYAPAWVFAAKFPNPTIIAQGVAHEVGHTVGLKHDGTTGATYYAGTDSWGPVMGSARLRAVTQFSQGEYTGASNREDDLAVVQTQGLRLRADDHGNTAAASTWLGEQQDYGAAGVVSTRADKDVFAFRLGCTTDLTVRATGIGPQTALDVSLRLLDASGKQVGAASPPSGYTRPSGSGPVSNEMDAEVTVPAATGTYYAMVDGVGNGSAASGGWSDYGSLGQFRFTATGCADASGDIGSRPPAPVEEPPAPVLRKPTMPRIGTASSGARGGIVTAVARWYAPLSNGGAAITRYRVVAQKLDSRNRVVRNYFSSYTKPTARAFSMRLPRGRYVFKVMAWNKVGASPWSKPSRIVTAR